MSENRPLRVLHCPAMVGGNAQELARAERELGLNSISVVLYPSSIGFEADEEISLKKEGLLSFELNRWNLFLRGLKSFDIIHFNFGRSIMPHWIAMTTPEQKKHLWVLQWAYQIYSKLFELRDLPIFKKAKKGIVVTYQGNDARQGDFCLKNFAINPVQEDERGYYTKAWDSHRRKNIKIFSQYADRIYSLNPDLMHVLPPNSKFLPYTSVNLKEWGVVDKPPSAKPVVIHAPTARGGKGTRFVLDAVSRLQRENVPFEFVLVEGMSRKEARSLYEKGDLLIDQLLIGWYGGLAVELMALGKPVICYIRNQDLEFIPLSMRQDLPIINATPDTLYEILKEWLTVRKGELHALGLRSRVYVERWHDPLKVADKMKKEYEEIIANRNS